MFGEARWRFREQLSSRDGLGGHHGALPATVPGLTPPPPAHPSPPAAPPHVPAITPSLHPPQAESTVQGCGSCGEPWGGPGPLPTCGHQSRAGRCSGGPSLSSTQGRLPRLPVPFPYLSSVRPSLPDPEPPAPRPLRRPGPSGPCICSHGREPSLHQRCSRCSLHACPHTARAGCEPAASAPPSR